MRKGFVIWLTGLPSSGKTTLGAALEPTLVNRGFSVVRFDGDEVRRTLSRDLGFSMEDRMENVRRVSFAAKAVTESGRVAIVSVIAPYGSLRKECRRTIGCYYEVHVDCPLKVCMERDVKGLYRRARAGELKHLTGVDDPYETPECPDIAVHTDRLSVEGCVASILGGLSNAGYLAVSPDSRQGHGNS